MGSGKEGKAPNITPVCSQLMVERVKVGELTQGTRDTGSEHKILALKNCTEVS